MCEALARVPRKPESPRRERARGAAKEKNGRRSPVQARSIQRRTAILDAAAHLFAEQGFEAATMEAIAERAQTSIGSVYQFFPHKLAVFDAVAESCIERSRAAFAALLAPGASLLATLPWDRVIDVAIDGFAALQASDPAFRAIIVNWQLYGVYADRDAALMREFATALADLLGARAPELPLAKRKIVARTIVQAVSGLLFLAERGSARARAETIGEAKVLVRAYIAAYIQA